MRSFLYGALAGFGVGLIIAVAVTVLEGRTAQGRIDVANAAAAHYEIAYIETAKAWEERARVVTDKNALLARVREENRELADYLKAANARVLSLANTVASLDARLDESATSVEEVEGSDGRDYLVHLDESLVLASGGYVRVHGPITITIDAPPTVLTELSISGRFPISVVISELANGELAVHAFTGDPRLTIASVDVTRAAVERGSLLANLADALSSPAPWIGAAVGVAACLVLSR
jgi:predicted regulator of Ras-like GTPase activity (Roadblock/LC7/MglB family)